MATIELDLDDELAAALHSRAALDGVTPGAVAAHGLEIYLATRDHLEREPESFSEEWTPLYDGPRADAGRAAYADGPKAETLDRLHVIAGGGASASRRDRARAPGRHALRRGRSGPLFPRNALVQDAVFPDFPRGRRIEFMAVILGVVSGFRP